MCCTNSQTSELVGSKNIRQKRELLKINGKKIFGLGIAMERTCSLRDFWMALIRTIHSIRAGCLMASKHSLPRCLKKYVLVKTKPSRGKKPMIFICTNRFTLKLFPRKNRYSLFAMGIHGLTKLLADHAPSSMKENEMKNYFGRYFRRHGKLQSFYLSI